MKIGPKYKICRRIGSDIFEKCQTPKYVISEAKKNKTRGKRAKTLTDYGKQLLNKQRVRLTYRVSEKQFSNYVKDAVSKKGANSAHSLYENLETRLDNVVYRLGLAASRGQSRQLVSHGHIDVNGRRITIPSFKVKIGDKVTIRERSLAKGDFRTIDEKLKDASVPAWLKFDVLKKQAEVVGKPVSEEVSHDLNSIIEFYSR